MEESSWKGNLDYKHTHPWVVNGRSANRKIHKNESSATLFWKFFLGEGEGVTVAKEMGKKYKNKQQPFVERFVVIGVRVCVCVRAHPSIILFWREYQLNNSYAIRLNVVSFSTWVLYCIRIIFHTFYKRPNVLPNSYWNNSIKRIDDSLQWVTFSSRTFQILSDATSINVFLNSTLPNLIVFLIPCYI